MCMTHHAEHAARAALPAARLQAGRERGYCGSNFLSPATMAMVRRCPLSLPSAQSCISPGSLVTCLSFRGSLLRTGQERCLRSLPDFPTAGSRAPALLLWEQKVLLEILSQTNSLFPRLPPRPAPPGPQIDGMRGQLLGELTSRGFAASLEAASRNAQRADLVRSVLVRAGLRHRNCFMYKSCRLLIFPFQMCPARRCWMHRRAVPVMVAVLLVVLACCPGASPVSQAACCGSHCPHAAGA